MMTFFNYGKIIALVSGVTQLRYTCQLNSTGGKTNCRVAYSAQCSGPFSLGDEVLICHLTGDPLGESVIIGQMYNNTATVPSTSYATIGGNGSLAVRYEELKDNLDDIKSKFNAHTHPENGGTTSPVLPIQQISNTYDDIKSTNVRLD